MHSFAVIEILLIIDLVVRIAMRVQTFWECLGGSADMVSIRAYGMSKLGSR